jgi:acyl carrier protein
MTQDERILTVVRRFVEDLGQDPAKIVLDAPLRDIGIDSLHAVDLVFRFEEEFEVSIPMDEFHATTVAEAMSFLNALLPPVSETSQALQR